MLYAPYHFVLFGSFTIEDAKGERQTRFRTRAAAAVAAFLALRIDDGPLRRAEITELFWPDLPDAGQRNSLSIALSALRSLLEPAGVVPPGAVVAADRNTVMLRPEWVTVDVTRFDRLLFEIQQGQRPSGPSPARPGAALREAIDLYRGPLLSNLDDPCLTPERDFRSSQFSFAVRTLCEQLAEAAHPAALQEAITLARLGVEREPGRDELHAELVRRLLAAGERTEARRCYSRLGKLLDALGEAPPADLVEALATPRSVKQKRLGGPGGKEKRRKPPAPLPPDPLPNPPAALAASELPPDPDTDAVSTPARFLPSAPTEFIGRRKERAHLNALLQSGSPGSRLVTLTGPGGIGKTRLALETARYLGTSCAALFVSLAEVTTPEQVGPTLYDRLADLAQTTPSKQPLERPSAAAEASVVLERSAVLLRETFAPGTLLVLDNLEQVVEGAGAAVHYLLEAVPSLRILATSRQELGLAEEKEVPLGPLSLPVVTDTRWEAGSDKYRGGDSDALLLFVRRVQAIRPEFRFAPRNAAAVIALVSRLEGIPLALELAAAQAGSLSPARMLERLERRLDFLAMRDGRPGPVGISDRHRSLRAAIAGSIDLLPPPTARFWSALHVFRGGFTAEAAAEVAGIDGADTDTDPSSELRIDDAEETLETLRLASLVTAAEDPHNAGEMRFTLLETLRDFAEELSKNGDSAPAPAPATRENRRVGTPAERHAAYFLALAERTAPRLYGREQHQWLSRMRGDHVNLHKALDFLTVSDRREEALRMAAALRQYWRTMGTSADAITWFMSPTVQQFLHDLALSSGVRGRAFGSLALATATGTQPMAAMPHWREAIALLRAAQDREGLADVLAFQLYEPALLAEAVALAEVTGPDHALSTALLNLAIHAWHSGDDTEAEIRFARCLDVAVRVGSPIDELGARTEWAYFLSCRCRYERAESLLREAIEAWEQSGSACRLIAHARWLLGTVNLYQGKYEAALLLLEQALAERRWGSLHTLCDTLRSVATARLYLGDRAGARLTLEESRQIGLSLGSPYPAYAEVLLARIALDEGDFPAARARLGMLLPSGEPEPDPWVTAAAEREAGRLSLLAGAESGPPWSPAAARAALPRLARSLRLRRDLVLPRLVLESLETVAGALAAWGDLDTAGEALRLLSRCRQERLRLAVPLPPPDAPFVGTISQVATTASRAGFPRSEPEDAEPVGASWETLADQTLAVAGRLSEK